MNKAEKVAIVTGGAQGIGKSITLELLKNNFAVIMADSDPEAGEETRIGLSEYGNIHFMETDVSNEKSVMNLIELTIKEFHRLDCLINNAGIGKFKPISELSLDEWNAVISINLTGTFLCSKYAAPYLKKVKGTIINMASTRAFMSEANTESYSASKGGVFSLTHALAMSLGPYVRVNSISPGWIEVSNWKKKSNRKAANLSDADHAQHPAGRVGTPEDVSRMVIYLIDPLNSFITGQNFVIDGGITRKMIYV